MVLVTVALSLPFLLCGFKEREKKGGERNFDDGSATNYTPPLPAINVYKSQPILEGNGRSEQVRAHHYKVRGA